MRPTGKGGKRAAPRLGLTVLVETRLLLREWASEVPSCNCWAGDPLPFIQPLPPSAADWVAQKQTLRLSLGCKIFIRHKHL